MMADYKQVFIDAWKGSADYIWKEAQLAIDPWWHNYLLWLVVVSALFFLLEAAKPWRENQALFRKDFWLDFFYMFFNYTLFGLIIFNAGTDLVVNLFSDGIESVSGFSLKANKPLENWPIWGVLLLGFVLRDFTQWWIHRLLHRVSWLWEFHKVHHSVEQMGFAAHLRYHWMENVVYRTLEYLPLALLGIGLHDFFMIHIFALALGHYNHSNLRVGWRVSGAVFGGLLGAFIAFVGFEAWVTDWKAWAIVVGGAALFGLFLGRFLKYIFNGPSNHIWHHAHDLPHERRFGVNFALSLSCWDYLFGTIYIPKDGRDIKLGFPGLKSFPNGFFGQFANGLFSKHKGEE